MNREILFRGKRADFREWVEGSLIVFSDGDMFICCADSDPDVLNKYAVDPSTVGQYTGLTDRNGVKIFEGDIIKSHYANAPNSDFTEYVVFHNGRFSATNDNAHWWTMLADGVRHLSQDKSAYMEWCEVIGNIYDNPELLKDGRPKEV